MSLNFSIQLRRIFLTKLVFFLFLSIATLVVDKNSDTLKKFRFYLSYGVVPVEQIITIPKDIYKYLSFSIASKQNLLVENDRLQTENTLLKVAAKQSIALELENIRLREMLNISYEINTPKLLIAQVIASHQSPSKQSISINKGKNYGIYLGQAVLDDKGVIGQIIDIKALSATVLLITDYQNYTPVMLKKSGKRFLAKGNQESLLIENVENIQEIELGDELVTSGLSGLYPAGYPVAIISKIIPPTSGVDAYQLKAKVLAGIRESGNVILAWTDSDENLYQLANQEKKNGTKGENIKTLEEQIEQTKQIDKTEKSKQKDPEINLKKDEVADE